MHRMLRSYLSNEVGDPSFNLWLEASCAVAPKFAVAVLMVAEVPPKFEDQDLSEVVVLVE